MLLFLCSFQYSGLNFDVCAAVEKRVFLKILSREEGPVGVTAISPRRTGLISFPTCSRLTSRLEDRKTNGYIVKVVFLSGELSRSRESALPSCCFLRSRNWTPLADKSLNNTERKMPSGEIRSLLGSFSSHFQRVFRPSFRFVCFQKSAKRL